MASLKRDTALDVRSVVHAVNDASCDREAVATAILAETAGLPASNVDVALGAYVWAEDLLRHVLQRLRAAGFGGRIILGGPQISSSGSGLEALYPEADAFIRGYGEEALATVAASAGRVLLPGVHWACLTDLIGQAAVDRTWSSNDLRR